MVKVLILLTISIGCSFATPAWASKGGHEGSGGGSAHYSTAAEVREAISKTPELAVSLVFNIYNYGLINSENIRDESLKNAVQSIFGAPKWRSGSAVTEEMSLLLQTIGKFTTAHERFIQLEFDARHPRSLLQLTENNSCSPKAHAEAFTKFRKNAPICFSVASLQRFGTKDLNAQLIGLFFHEISHQYEYSEEIAQKVQVEVLRAYAASAFANSLHELALNMRQGQLRPMQICAKLGAMTELASDVQFNNEMRSELLSQLESSANNQFKSDLLNYYKGMSKTGNLRNLTEKIVNMRCMQDTPDSSNLSFELTLIDSIIKSQ